MDNNKYGDRTFKKANTYYPQGNPRRIEFSIRPSMHQEIYYNQVNPYASIRWIFESTSGYMTHEQEKLEELDEYQRSKSQISFPQWWKQSDSLRFLQGNQFNIASTYEDISLHIQWRLKTLPVLLTNEILTILNIGFIYIHGRDYKYRPIIVINSNKLDFSQYFSFWEKAIIFLIQFVLNSILIPGKVENWNIIIDLKDASLIALSQEMKTFLFVLQKNYKCRLYRLYVLNPSSSIDQFKKLLGSSFIESKLKIIRKNDELSPFIPPSQLEEKLGGTCQNKSDNFFPPIFDSNIYMTKTYSEDIFKITPEDYYRLSNSDLHHNKGCNFDHKGIAKNKIKTKTYSLDNKSIFTKNYILDGEIINDSSIFGGTHNLCINSFDNAASYTQNSGLSIENFKVDVNNIPQKIEIRKRQEEVDDFSNSTPGSNASRNLKPQKNHMNNRLEKPSSCAIISHNGIISFGKTGEPTVITPEFSQCHGLSQVPTFNAKLEDIDTTKCRIESACSNCVIL